MPVHNLAKVFGPTIIGYSSAEPEALQVSARVELSLWQYFAHWPTAG
jgi:hypothetical protein